MNCKDECKLRINEGEFWYVRTKNATALSVVKVVKIDGKVILLQSTPYESSQYFVEYGGDTVFVQKRKGEFR